MTRLSRRPRSVRLLLGAAATAMVGLSLAPVPPAQAADYVPISGAGSTWSQVAVDAWRADVRASGVVVNFAGTGSTDGRSQFIQGTVDFANTEIPFQNPPEPGQQAEVPDRDFAYLPIVAGGTSFMYNLTVGGQRVRDLRLSAPTLSKIFTGAITRWSDPAIKADYGKTLPDIPIIPVVRSDGAGASAQFSLYMRDQAPDIYCPFIRSKLSLSGNDCPSVSFYPSFGSSKAQVGSNGVANYVSASYGAGSIGYVEYAYAKRIDFPVASLLNKAGYFAQPTAGNVAVALVGARINSDLTQNLSDVYNNPDPRTYPMSSYSYMVVPTSTDSPFNADKGKTLSTFINYFLCAGQQKADILGYSPLP
ncbi:MAG: phosphate ABC transporter substrate-binding protein, partial [Actinobacteria bacterium]|nr:phosphate ABC transporter substrate-binding protein [Actinomycetota bacterium]